MPASRRRFAIAAAALPMAAAMMHAPSAHAAGVSGAVYVLGNQPSGNAVIEYARAANGLLTLRATWPTGGTGTGSGLGSQGALVADRPGRHLYAVDAGSDTISSFRIEPGGLALVSSVPSGGVTPTSLTVHGDLVYVLNAGGTGNVTGFRTAGGVLVPLPGSTRPLSGAATAPAQVSFTPDGAHLLVTERATDLIDRYDVGPDGLVTGPATFAAAGTTPFGFGFDNKGHVIVSEAFGGAPDAGAASSYALSGSSLEVVSASVPSTETATCWIATTANGRFAYAGNAGSESITGYRVGTDGSLTALTPDGRTGGAPSGVLGLAVSADSQFLYARLRNGTVIGYAIGSDGSLTPLHAVGGLPQGANGIAAR